MGAFFATALFFLLVNGVCNPLWRREESLFKEHNKSSFLAFEQEAAFLA